MSAEAGSHRLALAGASLLLAALITGAAVPAFTNPRMGLSAHLTGVECGLMLIAYGWLWPKLRLGARVRSLACAANIAGGWALWGAFVLGAALGTSHATPMAGAGFEAGAAAEAAVSAILYVGVLGSFTGTAAVVAGLVPGGFGASGVRS